MRSRLASSWWVWNSTTFPTQNWYFSSSDCKNGVHLCSKNVLQSIESDWSYVSRRAIWLVKVDSTITWTNEYILIYENEVSLYSTILYSKLMKHDIHKQDIQRKKYPYDCFVVSNIHSLWIVADFLISETQQPSMIIILIIYSSYFLKDLVEL